ncbi:LuxR C-terminal-related transcriptional regulator [Nocardia brasiliensis]|uniref:LuxR C-terminal-related transcriptional regulator n=1 Tax=Nocardia brasiliensis TaxID=37326 RepID=UPI002457D7C4|nr:LuxR C-terminal-related transcriptional regulator [Nocardia brasiliensis]
MSAPRSRTAGALPASTHDFIGRVPELEHINALLLGAAPLITLIGAGGIGKTRLAAEAAHGFERAKNVPVRWVRLARLAKGADSETVAEEIAHSIVEADYSRRSVWEALVDTLSQPAAKPHSVLVMDNCEHVLEGVGYVITELLDAVPGLTVLATSREAIGWVDEQLVPVPPLSRRHALDFFRQRAELSGHSIDDEDQLTLADSICRHVHNHPLHIQLAAARLRRQPLLMILDDLTGGASDRRLSWSHGPRAGADERQQGIRNVIAWSYDLCSPKERLLFERMSVFSAGYDSDPDANAGNADNEVGVELSAIEAVCADSAESSGPELIARDEIAGLLERLTDQSLLLVHMTQTSVRYSLLESCRVFAQQQLLERPGDEWTRLTGRHRRHYRDKVAILRAEWYSEAEMELLDWARAAWDNILSAIDGSLTTPEEAPIGLEIAIGLIAARVPFYKGSLREARRWTEQTLAATRALDPPPIELQIGALALISWVGMCQGMVDYAQQTLDECIAVCRPDPSNSATDWRTEPDRDIGLPPPVEFARGSELMLVHRDPRAITVLARARAGFSAAGDRGGAAMAELFEALAAGFLGTAAQAHEITGRHLDNATRSGALWAQSWAELAWAIAATKHGDPQRAATVVRQTLAYQNSTRDQWGAVWAIHILAWAIAQQVVHARAPQGKQPTQVLRWALEIARLTGGAATWRHRLGVDINNLGPFADETAKAADVARQVLGPDAFDTAEREGTMLRPELDEVAQLALGALSLDKLPVDHPVRQHRPSSWHELSAAEQDVALLAAAGWTNSAIATRRGSSNRTVDAQMVSILHKLAIGSREDIATFVPAADQQRVTDEIKRRSARSR